MCDIITLDIIMYLHRIIDYTLMTENVLVKLLPYCMSDIHEFKLNVNIYWMTPKVPYLSALHVLLHPPLPYHTWDFVVRLLLGNAFMV